MCKINRPGHKIRMYWTNFQNNRFLRNNGTLKITILQCYEVLWIHNILRVRSVCPLFHSIVARYPRRPFCSSIHPEGIFLPLLHRVQFHIESKKGLLPACPACRPDFRPAYRVGWEVPKTSAGLKNSIQKFKLIIFFPILTIFNIRNQNFLKF